MQRPLTYGPRSVILTVTARPVFLLVTLTVEPNGSDLCAAVIELLSRGMPLAVLVPRCDESPTAYTDATHSSLRAEMLIKQNKARRSTVACTVSDFLSPQPPRTHICCGAAARMPLEGADSS
jgi:hypothetical protein